MKATPLATLREALAKQEKYQAEQAELERLHEQAAGRAKADHEAGREQTLIGQAAAQQRAAEQAALDDIRKLLIFIGLCRCALQTMPYRSAPNTANPRNPPTVPRVG